MCQGCLTAALLDTFVKSLVSAEIAEWGMRCRLPWGSTTRKCRWKSYQKQEWMIGLKPLARQASKLWKLVAMSGPATYNIKLVNFFLWLYFLGKVVTLFLWLFSCDLFSVTVYVCVQACVHACVRACVITRSILWLTSCVVSLVQWIRFVDSRRS